jgi:hypothetical protein
MEIELLPDSMNREDDLCLRKSLICTLKEYRKYPS